MPTSLYRRLLVGGTLIVVLVLAAQVALAAPPQKPSTGYLFSLSGNNWASYPAGPDWDAYYQATSSAKVVPPGIYHVTATFSIKPDVALTDLTCNLMVAPDSPTSGIGGSHMGPVAAQTWGTVAVVGFADVPIGGIYAKCSSPIINPAASFYVTVTFVSVTSKTTL